MCIYRVMAIFALLLVVTIGGGCASVKTCDLSTMPPFSQYAGKEVVLARNVVLVDKSEPNLKQPFAIVVDPALPDDPLNPDIQRHFKDKAKILRINAGTPIRVVSTQMINSSNIYTDFWYIHSTISISAITSEGWSSTVLARFDHVGLPYNDWLSLGPGLFKGTIRPAPWEPLDTPASRPIDVRVVQKTCRKIN